MAVAASEIGSQRWVRHAPGTSTRHLGMLGASSLALISLVLMVLILFADEVPTWPLLPHLAVGTPPAQAQQWLERHLTTLLHSMPILVTTMIFISMQLRQRTLRGVPTMVRAQGGAHAFHCAATRQPSQETDDMVPITTMQLDDSTTAAAQVAVQNLTTFTVCYTTTVLSHTHNRSAPARVHVHDGQRPAPPPVCPAARVVTPHVPTAVTHRPRLAPPPPTAAARARPGRAGPAAAVRRA